MAVNESIAAILWDFGGVFTTSPFESFLRFERERGLPENFIRTVNSTNHETNAWARLESSEISREAFDQLFADETEQLGHRVRGLDVLNLLSGTIRPRMVNALRTCKQHFKVGCITNNMKPAEPGAETRSQLLNDMSPAAIMGLFDAVVESSVEGVRKPDPRIYEIACARLDVSPSQCVFLDDLGINLKPARALGMITIKVVDPDDAIAELAAATGLDFP